MNMSKKLRQALAPAPAKPHTPGLLQVAVEIFDNKGMPETAIQNHDASATVAVALDFGPNNPDMRAANARRLVACWNSFMGCETELIEAVDALGTATMPYRMMQRSHADLLDALDTLCNGLAWHIDNNPTMMNQSDDEALTNARKVVAKAEAIAKEYTRRPA
jgi:hypothetical protein